MNTQHRIVVAGTGTEIGKTWTSVQLLKHLRKQGYRVAARKPAQSFEPTDQTTDADQLAAASGEDKYTVCPRHRWYETPMAPPMAADALGRPRITLEELIAENPWPTDADVTLIETAGGLCSPISHDADNLQLIQRLNPTSILLVADAGLGTLNSVRLCLRAVGDITTTVFLNRFDPNSRLHCLNKEWLERDGVRAVAEIGGVL
jgi:dethiobiotin synthetase